MKNILILIFLLTSFLSEGQVYYRKSEYGFALGGSNYFGDLNQNYGFKQVRYSGGVFLKYNFTNYIALKLAGNYAFVGYDDKFSSNSFQKARNLNFKSNIYETVIQAEFNFFQYDISDFDHRFTPYVTIGMGMFWYNPYTMYNDERYYLRPLGTEGQNYGDYADRKYKNTAVCFPIGLGFKYWINHGMTFGFEIANRSTTTDYIDDVSTTYVGKDKFVDQVPSPYPSPAAVLQDRSTEIGDTPIGIEGRQRGISTTRDKYMMMQFTLSFRFPTYKCPGQR
ncbi:MAG: hypothetical protein IPI46_09765 [Bacteroidetes bacterium]|nr:hypothetical protein [Bacteroidota bacterium]